MADNNLSNMCVLCFECLLLPENIIIDDNMAEGNKHIGNNGAIVKGGECGKEVFEA